MGFMGCGGNWEGPGACGRALWQKVGGPQSSLSMRRALCGQRLGWGWWQHDPSVRWELRGPGVPFHFVVRQPSSQAEEALDHSLVELGTQGLCWSMAGPELSCMR